MGSRVKSGKKKFNPSLGNALEFYPAAQIRAAQTVAVIKPFDPKPAAGGIDIAGLTAQAHALEALARQRAPL
jgi:hypothetical protein